jgi:cytochrome c biogenesis protein CcmG, thiol:disulfide interchange protein DsbE
MRRLLSPAPIAAVIGVVALLGLLAYVVRSTAPDASIEQALASGARPPAPAVRLPRLDGRGMGSLDDYRGRVVVLNYWASWCEPCRAESPLLERWHQRIEPRGGTVLGVDVLDVTSDAREFVRRYGLTYPMLRDAEGETQRQFGIVAYPETFVIDRSGRIAAARRGPVDDEFMRREVTPLLEERV